MSDQAKRWIIKSAEGRISGPYSAANILRQIEKGYLSGDEQIALHPGGDWLAISLAPEFGDKLLDVIASEGGPSQRNRPQANPPKDPLVEGGEAQDPSEQISPGHRGRGRVVREGEEGPIPAAPPLPGQAPQITKPKIGEPPKVERVDGAKSGGHVIELTDLKDFFQKEKIKSIKLPLLLIGGAVLLIIVALLITPEEKTNRMRLIGPRKGQPTLSPEQVSQHIKLGAEAFYQDTADGYLKAQAELVSAVEGAPGNIVAWGSLCQVYRELWQYAIQDARDLATVKDAMVAAKVLEKFGMQAGLCEIAYLNAAGRFREAKSLVDTYLTIPDVNTKAPAYYEIKAEFLHDDDSYAEAASYAQTARTLWPRWIKPYVTEARARAKQKEFDVARKLFQTVISANPRHQVARIEFGLIELNQFKQVDKAFSFLKTALDSGDRLPRGVEVEGHIAIAQIYESRKQISRALEHAKEAFRLNTSHPIARQLVVRLGGIGELEQAKSGRESLYLGDQYVRSGDCFAAQAEYKAAFESDPSNGTAAMKAGKCLWQLSQSGEAIEWLKKAIKAEPKLIPAYVLLSDYFSQRYDYLSAMRTLEKIRALAPRSFEVYRGFAMIEYRRNNFKGAIQFAQKARDLYDVDPETHLILAQAQAGAGMYVEAEKSALRAIELDETNTEAQSTFVRILVDLRGIDTALETIERLILDYSQIPEYRLTKGEILLKEERYNDAIIALREVLSLDPRNKRADILLGKAMQARNAPQDALQLYLHAAEIDPSDAEPIFLAGSLYAQEGKHSDAVRMFQRVLKSNPRYPRAHFQLGTAFLRMDMAPKALEEAQLERSINPGLADAYILAAEAYYKMGQFSNCAGQYQKAVALRPADSGMYIKMARCYRLSGGLDSAFSLLKQSEKIESGNPDLWKELGAYYDMRGMAAEAIHAYTRYLSLVPNAPDRAEIDAAIRRIESGNTGPGKGSDG